MRFRDEGMYKAQGGKTALYFGERLRVAHEEFKGSFTIRTVISKNSRLPEFVLIKAMVVVYGKENGGRVAYTAHGTADIKADSQLKDSLIELAETRAVARALRLAGIGVEWNDAAEIQRNPGLNGNSAPAAAPRPQVTRSAQTRADAFKTATTPTAKAQAVN